MIDSDTDGFAALADPTRRRIIALLAERDRTVSEDRRALPGLAARHQQAPPGAAAGGLVTETKRGRERVQRFDGSALASLGDWIRRYEAFWRERLGTLKTLVEDDG